MYMCRLPTAEHYYYKEPLFLTSDH